MADDIVAPNQHAVLVGPIKKEFTLSDGTRVDTRPDVVLVNTREQAAELAELVGNHYAVNGHPAHDDDIPFRLAHDDESDSSEGN